MKQQKADSLIHHPALTALQKENLNRQIDQYIKKDGKDVETLMKVVKVVMPEAEFSVLERIQPSYA